MKHAIECTTEKTEITFEPSAKIRLVFLYMLIRKYININILINPLWDDTRNRLYKSENETIF